MKNQPFVIAGNTILPGTNTTVLFPSPSINTQIKMDIPVHVFHGKKAGPKLFVVSAIHGDEVNSIEIVRRLHKQIKLKNLTGTIITVPVVNVYGVILKSRYLPDRRDLNRCFPGSTEGTLAARLAHGLIEHVVSKCDYGIDLHTGAIGRVNMAQLRVDLSTPGTKALAHSFNTPIILDAKIRDGSLRQAASELGIPLLVYEGGEALRFNELSIRAGLHGIMNVLMHLKMIPSSKKRLKKSQSVITQTSRWIRAPVSGLVQPHKEILAKRVKAGELLATLHDPFIINKSVKVIAPFEGIVIGQALSPLVSAGDALYHIASFKKISGITAYIEEYHDEMNQFQAD